MNSNTGTLARRQNSFGVDLCNSGGQIQNQKATCIRTLSRASNICEVISIISKGSTLGQYNFAKLQS